MAITWKDRDQFISICQGKIKNDIENLSELLVRKEFPDISDKLREMRNFVNRAVFELERSE